MPGGGWAPPFGVSKISCACSGVRFLISSRDSPRPRNASFIAFVIKNGIPCDDCSRPGGGLDIARPRVFHVDFGRTAALGITRRAGRLTCRFESSAKARDVKGPTPADSSSARHPSTLEAMKGCGLGAADGARNSASAPNHFRWVERFKMHRMLPHGPLVAGDAASAYSGCGKR